MKITELPSPYRELAEMRAKQYRAGADPSILNGAFIWNKTPEGDSFWKSVYNGVFPDIPQFSLNELGLIGGKTDAEWMYIFAGQAMSGLTGFAGIDIDGKIANTDLVAEISIATAKALLTKLKEGV